MSKPAKKKPAPSNAGRHCLYGAEIMKGRTIRMTRKQSDKLDRLGGVQWIRDKIEEA